MDSQAGCSQGLKPSCFHIKAINECRTKIVKIEEEKVPIVEIIQTLDDDIEEIEDFVWGYDDNIPEVCFSPIRSKQEDLQDERRELREQIEELNDKLKDLKKEIVEYEKYAKTIHCPCMRKNE